MKNQGLRDRDKMPFMTMGWLRGYRAAKTLVFWVLLAGWAEMAASAQTDVALQTQLDTIAAAHHGRVAFFAEQLKTGRTVSRDGDAEVQTASVIKLAILYESMAEVSEGKARWDEKLTLKPGDPVGGSGMLHFFDTPMAVTLKDVLTMMVIVSDNTATNLAIDRFGIETVNARLNALGLKHTHLYKKVFKPATGPMPADQPKFGLGKTTAREMAKLMTDIGECRLRAAAAPSAGAGGTLTEADKAVCAVGLEMLKSQFYRETIPRYLPGGGEGAVASKTGSLDAVRNDVALVAGKSGPMVISIFTYENKDQGWTVDNEGELTLAKMGKAVVEAWSPEGLDAKAMVPGLGLVATGTVRAGK